LDGKKIFRGDCSRTNSLETRGECHQSSSGVTHPRPLKAKRIEEIVLIYVWLFGIKALPDINYF
jgi:hypothetical protein